jgi:hypothetical protein
LVSAKQNIKNLHGVPQRVTEFHRGFVVPLIQTIMLFNHS